MKLTRMTIVASISASLVGFWGDPSMAGDDVPSEMTNAGSIVNTRHNLRQRGAAALPTKTINAGAMDPYRNDYGEVCVYCHTPHGANNSGEMANAPLWNRNINAGGGGAYTTYASNNSTTITEAIGNPGANSLTCLSCHDGTIAIDSIINMPGSGRYNATPDETFLDSWSGDPTQDHAMMGTELNSGSNNNTCMQCHVPGTTGQATDFSVFVIGTTLTNDHPIGITYPASRVGVDFNGTTGALVNGGATFYDEGSVGQMNDSDVRFYRNGAGDFTVECASCHDPHGVDSAGPGSNHLPTFLRKTNAASALCQTCHNK